MTRALITGITGQDGAYLAKLLLEKGYKVFGTYRRQASTNFWRLHYLKIINKIDLISADVLDSTSLYRALQKSNPQEVYHLAAQSFVGASFDQPIYTSDVTGFGTVRLLEEILKFNNKIKFYQASSSEMFGNFQNTIDENCCFKPRSPYGVAKVFAHHITNHYREAYKIFACCGILFNHESPLRGLEFVTRKITYELSRIKYKKQKKFKLGNIHAKRDWGFAGDYVEAMWLMLQQKNPDDFVIATGKSHSVIEFLEKAFNIADLGDWQNFVEIDEKYMRPKDIEHLLGDSSKARSTLGWKHELSFDDLVSLMVEKDLEFSTK